MKQIQPNDLRYILITDQGETILAHSPSGWEESLLNWKRDTEYFGLMRSFSMPMEFVAEGARILREEYYTNGLNANTAIRIEQLQRSSWKYKTIFEGDMDYSKFSDGRNKVTINVMEGGISKKVKANDNVEYEVEIDDDDTVTVTVPGIGTVGQGITEMEAANLIDDDNQAVILGSTVSSQDLGPNVVLQDSVIEGGVSVPDLSTSTNFFLECISDTNVVISGIISGLYTNAIASSVRIEIRNNNGDIVKPLAYFLDTVANKAFTIEINDFSYDMTAGEKLFIYFTTVTSREAGINIFGNTIEVNTNYVSAPTPARAFRPMTLFRKLLAKMNGGFEVNAQSFLLESEEWKRLAITCGDEIRRYTTATEQNPKIKTSFLEFFQSINAVTSCGFSVENGTAVLETKDYFMRANLQAADIGTVKEFNIESATDFTYNSIKTGYDDQDYEVDYGKDEFNSDQQWATPVDRVKAELNIMSPYRADQFGIEDQRLTTDQQNEDKQDKEWDNDIFMIYIKSDPELDGTYDVEGMEAYSSVSGILALQGRYNLKLSPKKNLVRHGAFIRSGLHRFEGRHLRFESGSKNVQLNTVGFDSISVKENEWILISSLDEPIFLPYLATVTSDYPRSLQETLTSFPYGYIRFKYRGYTWKGFIMEANVDVARNSAKEFKLLLTPDNNVLNFVH